MWGNFLSTIGKGINTGLGAAGRGIKTGAVTLADQMGEDEGDEGMMTTPPFIPGPSPTFPRGTSVWDSSPAPSRGPIAATMPGPMMAPPASMTPRDTTTMEDVPIPALPGCAGQHQPYSPMAKAKYDHVMRGATRTETPEGPQTTFKRSFKDIATNALVGGLQSAASGGGWSGAAGGALAAGAGTAINPMMGREYQFDSIHRPHMEHEEGKARTGRMQRYEEALMRGRVDAIPRDAERDTAQAEHLRTQSRVAIENSRRQQAETESRNALDKARIEALKTGKPKEIEVEQADGSIHIIRIWPDNTREDLGPSGRAALQQKRTTSQEKIATERNQSAERRTGMQQSGATGRTAMTQAGQDRRQADRIANQGQGGQAQSKLRPPKAGGDKGGGKTVSGLDADAFARQKKIDPAKWRAHLKNKGWTVKD